MWHWLKNGHWPAWSMWVPVHPHISAILQQRHCTKCGARQTRVS